MRTGCPRCQKDEALRNTTKKIYDAGQEQHFRTQVAFYSQHLIGVGHHFRNRQIVNALVKTCDVFFIDGGRPIPEADLDARVVRIPLPPLRAGAQGIESVDAGSDLQAVMHDRQAQLVGAMEQICPDVLCVEFFPFSRWSLKSEILNTIVRLNQVNPSAKVLCSLRDVPTRAKSAVLQPAIALAQRRDGTQCGFIPCLLVEYITSICLLIGGITRRLCPC